MEPSDQEYIRQLETELLYVTKCLRNYLLYSNKCVFSTPEKGVVEDLLDFLGIYEEKTLL